MSRAGRPVRCVETGVVYESLKAASWALNAWCSGVRQSAQSGGKCHGLHFEYANENTPQKNRRHLCPDCAVPISECGWWHGLRPPEGAKTGIRQISEYEGKGSRERVAVDRVIVLECPNYREAQKKKNESTLSTTQEPYHELANAIIMSAVKDYRAALRAKDRHKIGSIRRFFRSDYFSAISDLDPEALIKKLDEETKNDKTGT